MLCQGKFLEEQNPSLLIRPQFKPSLLSFVAANHKDAVEGTLSTLALCSTKVFTTKLRL